jgi:hypothetical protein
METEAAGGRTKKWDQQKRARHTLLNNSYLRISLPRSIQPYAPNIAVKATAVCRRQGRSKSPNEASRGR